MRTPEIFEIRDVQKMKVLVHFLLIGTGFLKYHSMNIERYFKRPWNLVYVQNFILEFELSQVIRVIIWLEPNYMSRLYKKSCVSLQEMKSNWALLPYLSRMQLRKWRYQEALKFSTWTHWWLFLHGGSSQAAFSSGHFMKQVLSSLRWWDYFKETWERQLQRKSTSMFYIHLHVWNVMLKGLKPFQGEF